MKIKLNKRERNHILAALRMWQWNPDLAEPDVDRAEALVEIATDGGKYDDQMTDEEIDELCERINTGG